MGIFYKFVDRAEEMRADKDFPMASMSSFPAGVLNPNKLYGLEIGVRFAEGDRKPYLFSATLEDKTTCKPITAGEIKRFAQFLPGGQYATILAFKGREENIVLQAEVAHHPTLRDLNAVALSRKTATHPNRPLYQEIAKSLGLDARLLESHLLCAMNPEKLAELCTDVFDRIASIREGMCARLRIGSIDPSRSIELTTESIPSNLPVFVAPTNTIILTIGNENVKKPAQGFEYGALDDAESLVKSYRP